MEQKILIHGRAVYEPEGFKGNDAILCENGRILEIGKRESLKALCPEAQEADLAGKFLCPSLVNTHVHLEFDQTPEAREHWLGESRERRFLGAALHAMDLLVSGVCAARDAGSSWALLELRDVKETPKPYLQACGVPITVTGGHLCFLGEEADSREEMIRAVRRTHKHHADAVKLIVTGGQMTPGSLPERVSLTTEEIKSITEEAHTLGLPTFAHCLTTEGFVRCMDGGVDSIEHVACFVRCRENGLLERVWEESVMEKYQGSGRFFMMGLSQGYHNLEEYREGKRPCTAREEFLLRQEERMFDIFKKCIALGLVPVCGTDAGTGRTSFSETWLELALMQERGKLPAAEAIRVCTAQSARCLGLEGQRGALVPGAFCDFVGLACDPTENIRAYAAPEYVFFEGRCVRDPD